MTTKETNGSILVAGLKNAGKTSLITAILESGKEKNLRIGAAKFFDGNLSRMNQEEKLTDAEKILRVIEPKAGINLITPYHSYGNFPLEFSFQFDYIAVDLTVAEKNLRILQNNYDPLLLETPPSLYMPITEQSFTLDWMKTIGKKVFWVACIEEDNLPANLSELEHLKRNGFEVRIILNNAGKIQNAELLFYFWTKMEQSTGYPVLGMIPFIDNPEENRTNFREKVEANLKNLFDFEFKPFPLGGVANG